LALKIVEAHISPDLSEEAQGIVAELSHESWVQAGGRFGSVLFAVVGAERTGEAVDRLHERLADRGGLLVLVQPLDGVLPRLLASGKQETRAGAKSAAAVSREEVYASIADTARLDRNYVALVILGALVVASQRWLGG